MALPDTFQFEEVASLTNLLTTELNSLADGANKTSAEIDNTGTPERFLALELSVAAQGSARDAGARVDVWLIKSFDDGSTYEAGGDAVDPMQSAWVGAFPLDAATTARVVCLDGIPLPPCKFKIILTNETGQAFAASGSTLRYARYSETVVD